MQYWSLGQMSNEEKENILSKHKEVYNGYQTMQPKVNNTQPLYVQDFAKDKLGATITNDGTVKPYTDYRINESHVMDTCEQCGGTMNEGECSECGWGGQMNEKVDIEKVIKKGVKKAKEFVYGKEKDLKKPYTAEAVDKIVSSIKGSKNEEQLRSTLKMFENLLDTNDDVLEVYKKRIINAFKRKAQELDFYLDKSMLKKLDIKEYKTGKLSDIYHEEDLNPSDDFDYVEGGGNDYGTFEKMHHMKGIKTEETATSNAPLSYGKHYNEIEPPYDFKSNGPVGDGGTLRQKDVNEGSYTGGGNSPDFEADIDPAFDFETDGPIEDTYTEPADDMDLDEKQVWKPYDFISGGADNGGDVYPMNEDGECEECWEKMESAWTEEVDEQDVSGVQGIYGAAEKPYAFVSTGPGKAGPYQTHSWGGEELSEEGYESEDEDVYWEEDLEPNELNLDLTKFNPEDKSWEEITAHTGEDEFSHLSEDMRENLERQQGKILEMFERFKKFL